MRKKLLEAVFGTDEQVTDKGSVRNTTKKA
jgi:hypothetical protein